jgi:hypothetical protein
MIIRFAGLIAAKRCFLSAVQYFASYGWACELRGLMQLALTVGLATQIVLARTISGMIMRRLRMQKALYNLEDRLSYSAAMARIAFLQRRIGLLSLWAGLAGDLVGEFRSGVLRGVTRLRGVGHVPRPNGGRLIH